MVVVDCGGASYQDSRGAAGSQGRMPEAEPVLDDQVLMRICGVSAADRQVTDEWLRELRFVSRLIEQAHSPHHSDLLKAVTLMAGLLGMLPKFNPVRLRWSCTESRGWIDRQTLECVGKQIAGFAWQDSAPSDVVGAIRRAVSRARHLGFIEEQRFDSWQPGMASGTGWRVIVAATPYGLARVRAKHNGVAMPRQLGAVPQYQPIEQAAAPRPRHELKYVSVPTAEILPLGETEQNIIRHLGLDRMTGEELAKKAGYKCNSNFKNRLSALRKQGILCNSTPGYYISEAYRYLLSGCHDQGHDQQSD
jgi:hypothetical protein